MKDNSKTLPYQHKLTVAVDRALMSRCRITGFGGITNVPADKSADYNPISSVCEQDEINEGRMTLTICPVDANLFA